MNTNYKYIKYNDYWQNSLQRLENIAKNLEKGLYKLEKKYSDFDPIFDQILTEINTLTSIYSSHNNLKGREYLLKLKAVFTDYQKRYTREGIDFKTIYFLNLKINELREISFEKFPSMRHSYECYNIFESHKEEVNDSISVDKKSKKYSTIRISAPYKWITFFKNGSWFILPYTQLNIKKNTNAKLINEAKTKSKIKLNNNYIDIIDIFSKIPFGTKDKAEYFITIKHNNEVKCFAATKLGRIIKAEKDIITEQLEPIKKNSISTGRIRIFGKNHLYI